MLSNYPYTYTTAASNCQHQIESSIGQLKLVENFHRIWGTIFLPTRFKSRCLQFIGIGHRYAASHRIQLLLPLWWFYLLCLTICFFLSIFFSCCVCNFKDMYSILEIFRNYIIEREWNHLSNDISNYFLVSFNFKNDCIFFSTWIDAANCKIAQNQKVIRYLIRKLILSFFERIIIKNVWNCSLLELCTKK